MCLCWLQFCFVFVFGFVLVFFSCFSFAVKVSVDTLWAPFDLVCKAVSASFAIVDNLCIGSPEPPTPSHPQTPLKAVATICAHLIYTVTNYKSSSSVTRSLGMGRDKHYISWRWSEAWTEVSDDHVNIMWNVFCSVFLCCARMSGILTKTIMKKRINHQDVKVYMTSVLINFLMWHECIRWGINLLAFDNDTFRVRRERWCRRPKVSFINWSIN